MWFPWVTNPWGQSASSNQDHQGGTSGALPCGTVPGHYFFGIENFVVVKRAAGPVDERGQKPPLYPPMMDVDPMAGGRGGGGLDCVLPGCCGPFTRHDQLC